MSEQLISELEVKLDRLINQYQQLDEAYQEAIERELALTSERASLIEKNEIARARIEAILPRIKQLEAAAE